MVIVIGSWLTELSTWCLLVHQKVEHIFRRDRPRPHDARAGCRYRDRGLSSKKKPRRAAQDSLLLDRARELTVSHDIRPTRGPDTSALVAFGTGSGGAAFCSCIRAA